MKELADYAKTDSVKSRLVILWARFHKESKHEITTLIAYRPLKESVPE